MPLLRFPIRIWRSAEDQGGEAADSLLREAVDCDHNDSTDDADALVDRQLVAMDGSECQLQVEVDSALARPERATEGAGTRVEPNGDGAQESGTEPLPPQVPDTQLPRPLRSPLPFPEITRFAPSRHAVDYLAHRRGLSRVSKKRDKHIVTLFMSITCLLLLCAAAVEPRWIAWSGTTECSNNQQYFIGLTDALLQNSVGAEQGCYMTSKLLVLLNVTTAFLTVTFVIILCAIALELAKPANPFLRTARRNAFCTIFGAILASIVNAISYVASETLRVRLIESTSRGDVDAIMHVQVSFTTGFYLVAAAASCAILQTAYVLLLSTALRRCASRCARRAHNSSARRRRPSVPPPARAASLSRVGPFNRSFYLHDPRRPADPCPHAEPPPPFAACSHRVRSTAGVNDDEPMLVLSSDELLPPQASAPVAESAQTSNADVLRVLLRRLTPPPAYAP